MAVLLIGSREDPHIQAVRERIIGCGAECFLIDSLSGMDSVSLLLSSGAPVAALVSEGREIAAEKISSVWFRLKPYPIPPGIDPLQSSSITFTQAEWRIALRALEHLLPSALWVNPIPNQTRASSKPYQLLLAQQTGLSIPDTVITNDVERIRPLFARHERVIYKSLDWFTFPDQTGIMTTEISLVDLEHRSSGIKAAPGIFQQFIPKKHELRVTVVGKKCFASRIKTPKEGDGSIDWRHSHFDDIFENYDMPKALEEKTLSFHMKAGLAYGAYDFVVSLDGRETFLECNPAGQFLWLEHSLGIDISGEIASLLLSRER